MTLTRLKQRTQPYHDKLERELDLLQLASVAAYTARLQQFLGFYAPLEATIARLPDWSQLGFDPAPRQKTALLIRDLRVLGLSDSAIAALPVCKDLPDAHDPARALGCMYVFEGATLGGQLIARQLHRRLGISASAGGAFFSSYGERVGPMWTSFRDFLAGYAATSATGDTVVAAACDTFIKLDGWLFKEQQHGSAE